MSIILMIFNKMQIGKQKGLWKQSFFYCFVYCLMDLYVVLLSFMLTYDVL